MIRLVRIYRSERGIWHYEIERNGETHWGSLRTRDEAAARRRYKELQAIYEGNTVTYDDDHWKAVLSTVIERIGMERFLELLGEVLHADLQKIIDEHMKTIEAQGEG